MTLDPQERQLVDYRALRDEAWALLKDDVAALRDDVEQRGLGARLADRVGGEARDVWQQTLEVAEAHRGMVAATIIALMAWLLRDPIARRVGALLANDDDENAAGGPRAAADANGEGDSR